MTLQSTIEALFAQGTGADKAAARAAFAELQAALGRGEIRAAEPDPAATSGWRVNTWVKQGILLGFRFGDTVDMSADHGRWPFYDKDTMPLKKLGLAAGVRIVPGGSTIRDGAFVAKSVVCMPPMFVNIGAYVGEGTMIDSHALVGSCAQIGARVHLSAGAQIGGVLEPAGARPVIVEDEAFVGGLCGVFEGVVVRRRAVLAAGVVLAAGTVIQDLVREREMRGEVPEGAVVVPGTRPAGGAFAARKGIQIAAPVIVKYRDAKTDAATALEDALR
jgi:2,3,4,5-tetrahydropyridine-2-carboxylate N-succinyltransferase